MRAGKLNSVISIQRVFETVKPSGAIEAIWTTIGTARAEVIHEAAEETDKPAATLGERNVTFRIRYRDDFSLADQFLYGGCAYDLKSVTEIGRRRGLEIRTKFKGAV